MIQKTIENKINKAREGKDSRKNNSKWSYCMYANNTIPHGCISNLVQSQQCWTYTSDIRLPMGFCIYVIQKWKSFEKFLRLYTLTFFWKVISGTFDQKGTLGKTRLYRYKQIVSFGLIRSLKKHFINPCVPSDS
jgi:hypothetical protein